MSLSLYGWNEDWVRSLETSEYPDGTPARVIAEHRELFQIHTGTSQRSARTSGRFRHRAGHRADFPAVGDWVVADLGDGEATAQIQEILPRRSKFSRKAAGERTDEQVVAANVDTVWIVSAMGSDLNPSRIERYLTLTWESGAHPVIVLTKTDLVDAPENAVAEVESRAIGVPVHAVSAVMGSGVEPLRSYLGTGQTIALLGSSGAGKSTLLNHLAGRDIMRVGDVRTGDGKGRHTTSHRQLVLLPTGGLLLDTPGMRELQLWSAAGGFETTFEDIETYAASCRFSDCRHAGEPGCAVSEALSRGDLTAQHFDNYQKLQRELAYLERKVDTRAGIEEKRRIKGIMKEYRRRVKGKE